MEGDNSKEEEVTTPPAKKLRCSEPDLKVILKYTTDDNGEEEQKEYHMHSLLMASVCKFIDTCMSVDLKEKKEREVVFQDVTPDLFEKAFKFLQNPLAIRTMTPKDALELTVFYDKYECPDGLQLCDQVLFEHVEKNKRLDLSTPPEGLELLIDAVVVADKLGLKRTLDAGFLYLSSRLVASPQERFGPIMFNERHVQKLQPMFLKNGLVTALPDGLSQADIESSLFPKFFVTHIASQYYPKHFSTIRVSGSDTCADGTYKRLKNGSYKSSVNKQVWNGERVATKIVKNARGVWVLYSQSSTGGVAGSLIKPLWYAPLSENLDVPPKISWVAVDETAKSKPPIQVEYK